METKLDRLAKYAWFVVGFNIVVILWGVFLRASLSGDGCGQQWLTCQGGFLPPVAEFRSTIEFTHRVTTSLAGVLVIVLLLWAFWRWRMRNSKFNRLVAKTAFGSFIFIVIEGLLGAGLVLTGNTAQNLTPERPVWMAAHLINTFVLLAFLTLTARYASGGRPMYLRSNGKYLVAISLGGLAIFLVGISGSIAALSSMIFPAGTLAAAFQQDLSPTSNMLIRLRLLHPITAILTSVFLIFLTGWLAKQRGDAATSRWSNVLAILVLVQIAFGATTLLLFGPIVLQVGHLLLADLVWISFVMFSANALSSQTIDELAVEAESSPV